MITIDANSCWCDRHRLPFKAEWPRGYVMGYVMATMALFTEATKNDEIISYCGGGEGKPADTEKLTSALLEFSPLCCLIGDERTAFWTDLALTPGAVEDFKQALDSFRISTGLALTPGAVEDFKQALDSFRKGIDLNG